MGESEAREVCLKPEYAEEYPDLEPGRWLRPSDLAARLVARSHARRRLSLHTRTFNPLHFEFRGGERPGRRPPTARTRATDRPKETAETAETAD